MAPILPYLLITSDTLAHNKNKELSLPEENWVPGPVRCLDRAVALEPEFIVVRIGRVPLRTREVLVELSAALKRYSHIRQCPVLALLKSKHLKLIEDLKGAGVDFVKNMGEITLNSSQMRKIIAELGPDDHLAGQLAVLCPFLHYRGIDDRHELTICGAYLDRMVLGGRRLHEICETEIHLHCEYYLNPRIRS